MISRFSRSFIAVTIALFLLATFAFLHPPSRAYIDPWTGEFFGEGGVEKDVPPWPYAGARLGSGSTTPGSAAAADEKTKDKTENKSVPEGLIGGGVIMSKLGNETAKAELGRATWRLLHTMTLRYPENPAQDEREALEAYMYLTARLYPCGECAAEFQELLRQFPPQTGSRLSASLWLCSVHNEVNVRLGKPKFDCSKLDAEYDCGCGDTPTSTSGKTTKDDRPMMPSVTEPMDLEWDVSRDDATGARMIKGGRR